MTLKEMFALCTDRQQVRVIVQKDSPVIAMDGESSKLSEYVCCSLKNANVCGIATDNCRLIIWVEESKETECSCAD